MRILLCCLLVSSVAIADEIYTVEQGGEAMDAISFSSSCSPPETRNGIVRINCSAFDGPVYFFDELTKESISICPFWGCDLIDGDEKRQTCKTECPPKQWPIEIPDCDYPFVESILGTWHLDSIVSSGGLSPAHRGWNMSFAADSVLLDFHELAQFERSYAVIENEDRLYVLELKDESGETKTLNVKLMPCGLEVETEAECSAFCENIRDDISEENFRKIASELLSGVIADNAMEEFIERHEKEWRKQPIFPRRVFFREVITD